MSDCPHNENNTDYCSICLRAKIERLEAKVAKLEADKCAWEACAQGHYEALSKANRRIAELEAAIVGRDSIIARLLGDTTPVDGYCGRRSSKAGLQAGEAEE